MPTISSMKIPPPQSWKEFEEITLDSCKIKWENATLGEICNLATLSIIKTKASICNAILLPTTFAESPLSKTKVLQMQATNKAPKPPI